MNHIEFIPSILICGWLLICSWQDIKKKKINLLLILAGFIINIIVSLLWSNVSVASHILGILPGLLLLMISYITRGQIGIGDGLILSITGIYLGPEKNIAVLAYGLFCAALFSIILLSFQLASRKKTIPFIPFILIGYLGVLYFA